MASSFWIGRSILVGALFLGGAAEADPTVVASLKPVHSLVAAVMRGVAEPILLVPDGPLPAGHVIPQAASTAIRDADVIIWLGQTADAGLAAAVAERDRAADLVTLSEAPGRELPPDAIEPHVWLDPKATIAMVDRIAATLSRRDPLSARLYGENAVELRTALRWLDTALHADLIGLRDMPYLVYEDQFSHFWRRYGLAGAVPVVIDPAMRRHLGGIDTYWLRSRRADWRSRKMRCIFYEPQADRDFVRLLIDDTRIVAMPLDPYGYGLPAGPKLYSELMRDISGALARCAARNP